MRVVQRPPRHLGLLRAELNLGLVGSLQRRAAGRPCIEQLLYFFPPVLLSPTRHPNVQTRGNIVKQPRKKRGTCMRLQATLPKFTSPPTIFRYKTKKNRDILTPDIHQDCFSESFLGEAQVTEGGGTDIARPSIHTPMMHQTRARLSTQNNTPNPQSEQEECQGKPRQALSHPTPKLTTIPPM